MLSVVTTVDMIENSEPPNIAVWEFAFFVAQVHACMFKYLFFSLLFESRLLSLRCKDFSIPSSMAGIDVFFGT